MLQVCGSSMIAIKIGMDYLIPHASRCPSPRLNENLEDGLFAKFPDVDFCFIQSIADRHLPRRETSARPRATRPIEFDLQSAKFISLES